MTTIYAQAEETSFSAKPGGKVYWPNPLNQGDSIDITINWDAWTAGETVASATWTADSGITVTGTTVSDPNTPATITAGATTEGDVEVEVKMTTSGGQIRSMLLVFEVVNLR